MAEKARAATEDNIFQKLERIRRGIGGYLKKDKKGYGYRYVSEEEILSRLTALMERESLCLFPGIVGGTTNVRPYTYAKTKVLENGEIYREDVNEVLVSADMVWTWVNARNPDERLEVPWALVGQQGDAAQAFGSGLTYTNRYFLLKFFNIATSDSDPDAFRSRQKETKAAADKLVSAEIVSELDKTVKAYLAAGGSAEGVKSFLSSYAKGGNYFSITDPALAAKLSEDFKKHFEIKE